MRSAVILAAGKGTRMKSNIPKVLHSVLDKPMLLHVIHNLKKAHIEHIVVIVGHQEEMIREALKDEEGLFFVSQQKQLGTAHALLQAEEYLHDLSGNTLVVCGDTPLIKTETIDEVFTVHESGNQVCTVLTAISDEPTGYGRILRNPENKEVIGIVEEKDATNTQKEIREINSGTYCFTNKDLFKYLRKIENNNAQGEYYLPDIIDIYLKDGQTSLGYTVKDLDEIFGVNDRIALARVEQKLKRQINQKWQLEGVTIIDPETTYIGMDVTFGKDVVIEPNVRITGTSHIATGAKILSGSRIERSTIGERSTIASSYIIDSTIGDEVGVGPFAHIRMSSTIGANVRVGNFVEIKKTTIGKTSAVAHLSYLGDAKIGEHVNIGCGSITANYDGYQKRQTTIEDGAFIGCNTNLIAPVIIGKDAVVAAGSTISQDVPEEALAIERGIQVNKEKTGKKMMEINKKKAEK